LDLDKRFEDDMAEIEVTDDDSEEDEVEDLAGNPLTRFDSSACLILPNSYCIPTTNGMN
jgi:hypothetical protein